MIVWSALKRVITVHVHLQKLTNLMILFACEFFDTEFFQSPAVVLFG